MLKILGGMVFAVLSEPLKESLLTAYRERLHYICEVIMNQTNTKRQEFARHLEIDCKPYVSEGELIRDVKGPGEEMEREMERINQRLDRLADQIYQNGVDRSVSSASGLNIS